jgi:hypothetical protein
MPTMAVLPIPNVAIVLSSDDIVAVNVDVLVDVHAFIDVDVLVDVHAFIDVDVLVDLLSVCRHQSSQSKRGKNGKNYRSLP